MAAAGHPEHLDPVTGLLAVLLTACCLSPMSTRADEIKLDDVVKDTRFEHILAQMAYARSGYIPGNPGYMDTWIKKFVHKQKVKLPHGLDNVLDNLLPAYEAAFAQAVRECDKERFETLKKGFEQYISPPASVTYMTALRSASFLENSYLHHLKELRRLVKDPSAFDKSMKLFGAMHGIKKLYSGVRTAGSNNPVTAAMGALKGVFDATTSFYDYTKAKRHAVTALAFLKLRLLYEYEVIPFVLAKNRFVSSRKDWALDDYYWKCIKKQKRPKPVVKKSISIVVDKKHVDRRQARNSRWEFDWHLIHEDGSGALNAGTGVTVKCWTYYKNLKGFFEPKFEKNFSLATDPSGHVKLTWTKVHPDQKIRMCMIIEVKSHPRDPKGHLHMYTGGGDSLTLSTERKREAAILLGPSIYQKRKDSPFAGKRFKYFHLETFEQHKLTVPGVVMSTGGASSVLYDSALSDSVDEDDGVLDGKTTKGDAWWAGGAVEMTFDRNILKKLPTHAGIVWTDGGGTITFEAWDEKGDHLGKVTGNHSDGDMYGKTAEDRFYGVIYMEGISKIKISNPSGIEIDHLQYGSAR